MDALIIILLIAVALGAFQIRHRKRATKELSELVLDKEENYVEQALYEATLGAIRPGMRVSCRGIAYNVTAWQTLIHSQGRNRWATQRFTLHDEKGDYKLLRIVTGGWPLSRIFMSTAPIAHNNGAPNGAELITWSGGQYALSSKDQCPYSVGDEEGYGTVRSLRYRGPDNRHILVFEQLDRKPWIASLERRIKSTDIQILS